MKTTKLFLLIILILCATALVGCTASHSHRYSWAFDDNPDLAFQYCKTCLYIRNFEESYSVPIKLKSEIKGLGTYTSHIPFTVEVDSGIYDYGEEFDIRLKVSVPSSSAEDGPLFVKLVESPYYEIVSDGEYIVEDFGTQDSPYQTHNFTFRVKPTNTSLMLESFDFKIKFNLSETGAKSLYYGIKASDFWYYDQNSEYFYGFKVLKFINNSDGMLISDSAKSDSYMRTFFDGLNRDLINGVIDKDTYMDRFYEYCLKDSYQIRSRCLSIQEGIEVYTYLSKNIRAEFKVTDSYERFNSLFQNEENYEESRAELAKILVGILYENNYITREEYDREIELIENNDITYASTYYENYRDIPSYMKKYFEDNCIDMFYEE